MRLSSLARRIRITPKNLTSFLEENDVILEKGANTKLDEEVINLILKHFKVSLEEPKEAEPEENKTATNQPKEADIQEELLDQTASLDPISKNEDSLESIDTAISKTEETKEVEDIKEIDVVNQEPITEEKHTEEVEDLETPLDNHESVIKEESTKEESELIEENSLEETEVQPEESKVEILEQKEIEEKEEITPLVSSTKTPTEAKEAVNKEYKPIEAADGTLIEARAELLALDDSVDIIKAPKPEPLQGLTIKGKIELPDPKVPKEKKPTPEKPLDPNAIIYTSGPQRERRKKNTSRTKNVRKPKQGNSVDLERQRQARKAQKDKERKERLEKEVKAAHYEKKLKTPVKQKIAKKKPKKKNKIVKEPKFEGNAIQRFWHWLNT